MKNGPYELVKAPEDYPGKRYRGRYCYEHHLVWWQNTGQIPTDGFVIHHKNENKRDNRFSNLELTTRADHTRHHAQPAPIVSLSCFHCHKSFDLLERKHRHKQRVGQSRFFYGRSCQVKQQWRDNPNKNPRGSKIQG